MLRALIFLRLVSFRNLVVHRLARLRQPKYLVAAGAAAAYVYYFLVRPVGRMPTGGGGAFSATADIACGVLCAMALLRIAYCWVVPAENPGLAFSEAEIAFLFPAPLTRRMLVQYRLVSSQLLILLTAVIVTLVANRGAALGGGRLIHTVGWWVILSTLDLHINGTKLTIARLRQNGATLLAWRVGAVAVIAAYVAALAWSVRGWLDEAGPNLDAMILVLKRNDPFRWLTLPFRIVVGPYYSATLPEFAWALLPALVFLGLHYFWVSTSGASFEEGSIALAEKRAAIRAAIGRGAVRARLSDRKQKPLPGPFPLPPRGLPEVAFLWKNLLSMRSSLFGRRALVVLLALALSLGQFLSHHSGPGRSGLGEIVLVICAIVAGYTIIFGPQLARQDLRSDLANADILKTYPLEGWRLALGEVLAPAAILTAILWAAIVAAAASLGPEQGLATADRATAVVCLAAVAPVLCVIQLLVPNMLVVLMPGWYQASRSRTAGIEVFGQRLVFSLMQFLISLLVLVPAGTVAALVCFSSYRTLGLPGGMLAGSAFALFMLGGEAAVGLWFLGERFERLDLSTDSR